jgi:hypothetical protein
MKENVLKVREIKLENRINNYNENKNIVIIKPKHKEKSTKSVEFIKLKKENSPRQHINKNLSQNFLFDKLIIFTDDTMCQGINNQSNSAIKMSPIKKRIINKEYYERNSTELSEDKDKLRESDLEKHFLYEPYGKNYE